MHDEQEAWRRVTLFEKATVFFALLICAFAAIGAVIGPANSASYPHTGLANDGSELVKFVNGLGDQAKQQRILTDILVSRVLNLEKHTKCQVPKELDVIEWHEETK